MKRPLRAGIALGSNLGDRMGHLRAALAWLRTLSIGPVQCSHVYETAPRECAEGSPAFLNAVCEATWDEEPSPLLGQLRDFERKRGRPEIYAKNAPRPLDLDLLYMEDRVLRTEALTLPHPRMLERPFVLRPLCDICPQRILPGEGRTVAQILARLDDQGVRLYHESLQ